METNGIIATLIICAVSTMQGCSPASGPSFSSLSGDKSVPLAENVSFQTDESPVLAYQDRAPDPVVSTADPEGQITLKATAVSNNGSMSLSVTDAPASGFDAVFVTFSKIE